MNRALAAFAVVAAVLVIGCAAPAQNLLTNPGFETGDFTGWTPFGNAFVETANPPQFVPHGGNHLVSMFGNFSGGFNVTGIFQQFPAAPGDSFAMDCWSRQFSGDALVGIGPPADNWVVMKIAFFDGGGGEIGGAETTVMDGTFPADVWIDNTPVQATAPPGTVSVQALILYLQPAFAGGACHIDDVTFEAVSQECYLLISLAPAMVPVLGQDPWDVLYIDLSQALAFPVTMQQIPIFPVPTLGSLQGLHFYGQIAMYNPMVFPNDPLRLSQGLDIEIGGSYPQSYGTSSGVTVWANQPTTAGGVLDIGFFIPGL